MYRRRHLKALVRLHGADGEHTIGEEPRESGGLTPEEVAMLTGVLGLGEKTAEDLMISLDAGPHECLPPLLCESAELSSHLLQQLSQQASDVAFVHAHGNTSQVLGLLPLRRLLALPRSCDALRLADILQQPSSSSNGGALAEDLVTVERQQSHGVAFLQPPCRISSDASLYQVLVSLRNCRTSVALVEQVMHEGGPPQVRGVLHLQRVLEELVLSEAVDSCFRRLPTLSFLPRTISGHLGGPRVQRFTLPSRRELFGDATGLLDPDDGARFTKPRHTDPLPERRPPDDEARGTSGQTSVDDA